MKLSKKMKAITEEAINSRKYYIPETQRYYDIIIKEIENKAKQGFSFCYLNNHLNVDDHLVAWQYNALLDDLENKLKKEGFKISHDFGFKISW